MSEPSDLEPDVGSWLPADLVPVLVGDYQSPQATVGARADGVGMFYPGHVHSCAGESESAKTFLLLGQTSLEIARTNTVIFVDFEDDAGGIVSRLRALGTNADDISTRFAYVSPRDPIGVGRNRDDFGQALRDLRPSLVVLDGVTEAMTMHGLDPLNNKDAATFSRLLPRAIAATGAAVVLADHVTKTSEGRGRYAIGAVHKLNALDGAAYLLEARQPFGVGLTGRSSVFVAKDRPGQIRRHANAGKDGAPAWFGDFVLTSHDETFVEAEITAPTAGDFRPTVLMQKVAHVLGTAPDGLSVRQVQELVIGKQEYVRKALEQLVADGYADRRQGSRGSMMHTLLKPYEDAA